MGKRKKIDQEEDEGLEMVMADEASSSHCLDETPQPTAKRRKELDSSIVSLTNGSPSKRLNGHIQPDEEESHAVWLVRKPINMPLEDLHKIRFSKKPKYRQQEILVGDDEKLECSLETPSCTMVHATSRNLQGINQKSIMHTDDTLRGIVRISRTSSDAIEGISGSNFNDISMRDEEKIEIAEPIQIRRKPVANEEDLKERLKAYGHVEQSEKEANEMEKPRKKKHKKVKIND